MGSKCGRKAAPQPGLNAAREETYKRIYEEAQSKKMEDQQAEIEQLQEEQKQIARILGCPDTEDGISTPSNLPNVIRDKLGEIEQLQKHAETEYQRGLEEGSSCQAILEIQGRERFLAELKTEQQDEIKRLRDNLLEYGHHQPACINEPKIGRDERCDCGWRQLREATEAKEA